MNITSFSAWMEKLGSTLCDRGHINKFPIHNKEREEMSAANQIKDEIFIFL